MYSVLPAIVAVVFLAYGVYALRRKGPTRIAISFFVLCATTFSWQFAWAVLFQVSDPAKALVIIKTGYLLILFLPTSLYHFLVELTERRRELPVVYVSYVLAAVLGIVLVGSDRLVAGYYEYFWGYYPKAGPLHWLHLLQTVIVITRGLYITYRSQRNMPYFRAIRLRYCFFSLLVYFFAAIDYLCNYGFEFYPPGVLFVSISLGIMTVAIVKYRLMDDPVSLAANLAHQVRTPLMTIEMQASAIEDYWPQLVRGYELAVEHGLCDRDIQPHKIELLRHISQSIEREVQHSNYLIDMLLSSTSRRFEDSHSFDCHSARECVSEAVSRFPFGHGTRERVTLELTADFDFYGSEALFMYIIFNLLKNALDAIAAAGKGEIEIRLERGDQLNKLYFTDTASGIDEDILPHIFDHFFTTKKDGAGTGIGLAFCRKVMTSFKGDIRCVSRRGEYTTFKLVFPRVESSVLNCETGADTSTVGDAGVLGNQGRR